MITAKLNYDAIDVSRLFPGKKGRYLDICLIESPNSAYGDDYMVTQSVSKEDRENGIRGAILGNGKIRGIPAKASPSAQATGGQAAKPPVPAQPKPPIDDDVPF